MRRSIYIFILFLIISFSACRNDMIIIPVESNKVSEPEFTSIEGFYLLNEGNMGSNKASIDYYDATTGMYNKNIYADRNPTVVKELGDVGNDLQIYGSKMYAVINCSHKVEVMDKEAVKICKIDIPNCRYLVGNGGYVYVSSYVAPVQIDPTSPKGAVYKVDTLTMSVVGTVEVGYQPEEMAVVDNKLYVANSGGYRAPDYDNTISVIDLNTFTKTEDIEVAINLHRVKKDKYGRLYVSSRGDYYGEGSALYVIDTKSNSVIKKLDIAVSNMCVVGDSAYVCSAEWAWNSGDNAVSYGIVNLKKIEVVNRNFITDGTDAKIKIPYGIAVNPITKDIYVTDARNYVSSGTIYCFNREGILKWSQKTGDIPAHFAFKGEYKK